MHKQLQQRTRTRRLLVNLSKFIRRSLFLDSIVLLALNLAFAFNYLVSPSDEIPGFAYRSDAYSYPLFAQLFINLVRGGLVPLGTVWVPQVAAGHSFFIVPDPLYAAYSFLLLVTNDFVFAYKIVLFLLYLGAAFASYYLASILLKERVSRLVVSCSYTFSQTTLYEVSLGHLSMAYGMVLIPLIVGFLLRGSRDNKYGMSVLSGFLLFFLIIEREDYGYMMVGFALLLMIYHVFTSKIYRKPSVLSTILTLSTAFLFSFPYLQFAIFSKLSLWEAAGSDYSAYSPTLLQLVAPIFSNVEAYLGIVTIFLAAVCFYGLVRGLHSDQFRYESKFFKLLGMIASIFVILGLGSTTPVYSVLYTILPSFTGFRGAAGNPTFWLQPSKLCLAVLAGGGVGFVSSVRFQPRKVLGRSIRIPLVAILLIGLVLDGGTFLAVSEPYSPIVGWNPIATNFLHYNLYESIQTSPVPPGSAAYNYVTSDPGNYSVLEIPNVYSLPNYQYLKHLATTSVNELNPYGIPDNPSIFSDIFSSNIAILASAGNASTLASDLALVGVKYLVYEGYWSGPYFAQGLNQSSTPFQFVLQDQGVSLFRNLMFGQNHHLPNLLFDSSFETSNNTAWVPWNPSDNSNCTFACFVNAVSYDGSGSLQEVAMNTSVVAGRSQMFGASTISPGRYLISGWNRASDVSSGAEFGIRLTGVLQNGTEITLSYAPFGNGSHDWQYSQSIASVQSSYNLTKLTLTTYLRSGTGVAWVDDLGLQKLQPSNDWDGVFAIKTLYPNSVSTIAQQNLVDSVSNLTMINQMEVRYDLSLGQSAVVILPISFDAGWRISSLPSGEDIQFGQYQGLMMIKLAAGPHHLLAVYHQYRDSLFQTAAIFLLGLIILATPIILTQIDLSKVVARVRRRASLYARPFDGVRKFLFCGSKGLLDQD